MFFKKKKFSRESFAGVGIVLIFASVVSAYVYFLSDVLNDQYSVSNTEIGGGAQHAEETKKAEEGTTNIWENLSVHGLSGEYYELSIQGVADEFASENCIGGSDDATIFIRGNGDSADRNQILVVQDETKGKRTNTSGSVYSVRDACTASLDNDPAEITIPYNEKGYIVTARALGRPTQSFEFSIQGNLMFTKDEFDNDFLVLGVQSDTGFFTETQMRSQKKMKGAPTDISGLFEWSGSVCYFSPEYHCSDDSDSHTCAPAQVCCLDTNEDGVSDSCTDATPASDGTATCVTGTLTDVACRVYTDEWVFSIDDFVASLWNVDDAGHFKDAQIRLYQVQ